MNKQSNAFMGYGKAVSGNTVPQTPTSMPASRVQPAQTLPMTPPVTEDDLPKVAQLVSELKKLANG